MSQYRDDLQAARMRIEALEADRAEQEAELVARTAELDELRAHARRLEEQCASPIQGAHVTRHRFAQSHFFSRSHGFVLAPILVGSAALIVFAVSPGPKRGERPTPYLVSEAAAAPVELTDRNVLASSEAVQAITLAEDRLWSCHRTDQPEWGGVTVTFDSTGTVASAHVAGPASGTEVGDCVEQVMRSIRIPEFSGASTSITLRFTTR